MTMQIVRAGIVGGVVGAVVLQLFLVGAAVLTTGAPPLAIVVSLWQFAAEEAIGNVALTSSSYAWIGGAVYFIVSIVWAVAFAYVARRRAQVVQQPIVSGIVYGVIVWIGTQLVLVATGLFKPPAPNVAETELIAYCVFFGLPLAYTVRRFV